VLAGPACRCPTAALPHLPLSLLHPAFDTGPRCRPAPPVSHAAPRCPRPTALPCSPACLHCERVLPPSIVPPRAIVTQWSALPCRPPTTLSHFPSSAWHQADPPPNFHLCSSHVPVGLEKTSAPHFALRPCPSSSSPPSPPPMCAPHRLPPSETPPPL
jgi:hypothetical protein